MFRSATMLRSVMVAGVVGGLILVSGCEPMMSSSSVTSANLGSFEGTTFASEILDSDEVVIVDFTASWCPPCQDLKPILHELDEEGIAKVVEIDVDRHNDVAARFSVTNIPRLLIMKNGEIENDLTGFQTKANLERIVAKVKKTSNTKTSNTKASNTKTGNQVH